MHDYSRLRVWRRAMALATDIYERTTHWPRAERFGLTAQIRRAAVSVPSNIAEGAGRGTRADFARFVRNAIGSLCEVETLIHLARNAGYADSSASAAWLDEAHQIRRMLKRLELRLTGTRYEVRSPPSGAV